MSDLSIEQGMNEKFASQSKKGQGESEAFLSAFKERRTYYQISKNAAIPDSRVEEIVKYTIKHVPSSFNGQTTRALILFNEDHDEFWNTTSTILSSMLPADQMAKTQQRLDGFKAGHGTVLFFDDESVIRQQQEAFKLYADNFPIWANQSNGMAQLLIWTALEKEGFGASLQHYNPLVDAAVQTKWKVPLEWKLLAQMPFGVPTGEPGPKDFKPLDERVWTAGKKD
ncbi:hypothetical protein QFC20_004138 [Naganishia adeliensis]|uniref:Uncharacterized protein n=1 Tax=Naganishia adeliensis TaxID=92952 RepID=A0ACC2W498_9TREE|nr:hypothetical protein QFC20_004138 [Naganishia adeliensis]